jgi:hypothetical protein
MKNYKLTTTDVTEQVEKLGMQRISTCNELKTILAS